MSTLKYGRDIENMNSINMLKLLGFNAFLIVYRNGRSSLKNVKKDNENKNKNRGSFIILYPFNRGSLVVNYLSRLGNQRQQEKKNIM